MRFIEANQSNFYLEVENQTLGNVNFKKKIGKEECCLLDVKGCLKDRTDKSLVTVLCSSNKQMKNNMLQNRAEYYMWVINFQEHH